MHAVLEAAIPATRTNPAAGGGYRGGIRSPRRARREDRRPTRAGSIRLSATIRPGPDEEGPARAARITRKKRLVASGRETPRCSCSTSLRPRKSATSWQAPQARLELTYAAVGLRHCLHAAVRLQRGPHPDECCEGEKVFQAAKAALQRWEHFRLGWVEALPPQTPIRAGQVVAVAARGPSASGGSTPARILLRRREMRRTGFWLRLRHLALATPRRGRSGSWSSRKGGSVWYDLLAFSQPRHFPARLGYPYTRILQKRFARDSSAAMRRAVEKA